MYETDEWLPGEEESAGEGREMDVTLESGMESPCGACATT